MSAVPKPTTPRPLPGQGLPPQERPATRRPGPGRQSVGAAGQARRSLQRDLARREASLRVNRRVSGPVGGIVREAAPQQRPSTPQTQQPQQRAAMPAAPPQRTAPAPQQRVAPAPRQRVAPAQRPRVAPAPQRTAPVPQTRVAPARVAPQPLANPQLRPAQRQAAPARPVLVALDGAAHAGARRRLSTPAWIVSSIVMLVVTIGAVVALQIQMTQVNEQIGADLASITRQEQRVTQLRERISRQVGGARIEGEAGRRGLVQPDVSDVRYLKAGNRADTARRAAEALAHAPSQSAIAAAAAAAAAGTTTADGTTTTATTGAAQSVAADPATVPAPAAAVVTTTAPGAAPTP